MNHNRLEQHGFEPKEVDAMHDLASSILQSLHQSLDGTSIRFEVDVQDGLEAFPPERALTQAIDQLIRYAMRRCNQDGELLVSARIRGNQIDFEVADSGEPISAPSDCEVIPAGSDLPVPIEFERARRLVASMGGQCRAMNCPQGGVAWTINIPRPNKSRR